MKLLLKFKLKKLPARFIIHSRRADLPERILALGRKIII
jgi:hypothetical protein